MNDDLFFALVAGIAASAGVIYYGNIVKLDASGRPKGLGLAEWQKISREHKNVSKFGIAVFISSAMVAAYFSKSSPVVAALAATIAVAGSMLWYEPKIRLYRISKGRSKLRTR